MLYSVAVSQETRGKVLLAHQIAMLPLEEQLEGLQKAIVTAQGLKRRNIQSEIEVRARRLTSSTPPVRLLCMGTCAASGLQRAALSSSHPRTRLHPYTHGLPAACATIHGDQ